MKKIVFYLLLALAFVSCTDNQKARSFGGEETVNLEAGMRLINATWKQDDLWFLVEPMPADYTPVRR